MKESLFIRFRSSIYYATFLLLLFFSNLLLAQSPCMTTVPSFTIDLTGNPAGIWSSPNISRNDQCCTATSPDQCIYFNLTLDPNTAGIQIDMIGADPAGSLFYDIGCTGHFPGGQIKCITGVGPHQITFCKPGGNKNVYKITAISRPLFPKDDTVRIGCKTKLTTLGIVNNSVTWQSIFPGAPGQYNSYLDSTNVASPTYSPQSGAPAYVDYKVCGFPIASGCGYSLTVCDTVRIYNYPVLTGTVTPNPATFCNIGPGSGVTLSGVAGGGLAPYTYSWFSSTNSLLGTGSAYTATAQGAYKLEIKDRLYDPATCPSSIVSPISVSVGVIPTVDAGVSTKICASSPTVTLSGSVLNASGGIWSGGGGTFNPGNTFLNTNYTPSAGELAAGFVKLYLTSTGAGGGCVNAKDSTYIYFSSVPTITISAGSLSCNNSTTTIQALVSGGTMPYTYSWNTGSALNSITGGEGNYSVIVRDSLGCSSINTSSSVVAPTALNLSFSSSNVFPDGSSTGTASVSVSGGTPAYSVVWAPGGATTFSIGSIPYGVYSATVTDANGCKISGSTVVGNSLCSSFTATSSFTNILCYDEATGSAIVNPSGGVGAYTYTWNTVPAQNTALASGLQAGVYTATVEDQNGCFVVKNITISEPTQLTTVMTHTDVTIINGNNGAAAVNAFGGTTPYTYLWSNSSTSSSISNLFAGTYTVGVTDNKGCVKNDSIKITQPPCNGLVLNVYTTNALCHGGKGSAFAIVSGAKGTYTVNWSNGTVGQTVSDLAPGNYSVSVMDSENCSEYFNFTITEPSPLTIGVAPINISCNGTPDGSIDVTVSGGTFPYYFNWNTGSTSEDLVGLKPNTYSVTVLDANGCSASGSAVITEPLPLAVTYTSQNVTCIYGNNGSVSLNVTGGTTPYVYTWSTGATTSGISNLLAGGYTVSVSDANFCKIATPLIIGIGQPDSVRVDSFIVSCSVPGSNQTQVQVVPYGGYSGTYQVSFNNGGSYLAPGVYTTMLNNAATYSVILKDANNCSSLLPDVLTILGEVKIDSVTFGKCFAVGTTSVPVSVYPSGGDNGPYTVSFNNGTSYLAAGTYSSNLAIASSYSVVIKDSRGCVSAVKTITLPATFNATTQVTSNYNGQNISCFGVKDGSVSVTVTGGSGTYSYTWTSTPTQSTAVASGLGAGTYSVIIKDGNNCSITKTVTLTQPAVVSATTQITSNYNGQNISCFGLADGSASVSASGGTAPFTYAWNSIPTQTTSSASGLSAGTYSVLVKDINNCSVTKTVTLTQPAAISGSVNVTSNYNGQQISCFGATDASIAAVASNGTAPYTYTWTTTPVQTGTLATGIGAGTYSVVMRDNNGCSITKTVSVTQPLALGATTSVTSNYNGQNISCFGLTNGSASVTVNGGTGAYSYTWSSTPAQNTSSATNIGAGNYTVTVKDVNNCVIAKTVTLTQPTAVTATAQVTSNYNGQNISCFGLTDGTANVNVNGGTGAYSYTWSSTPTQTTATASNLGAGIYTITVRDINNCTVTNTVSLTQPASVTSTAQVTSNYNGQNISCYGYNDGTADVTANGGTMPYTYFWNSIPSQTTALASNLVAGTYSVTVKDVNNCSVTTTVALTQPAAINSTITVTSNYNGQQVSCYGVADASISIVATNGTPAYSYSWSTSPAQTGTLATNIGAGTYSVVITDVNGCSITNYTTVTQPAQIAASASVTSNYNGQSISCFGLSDGSATVTPIGGTTPYTYVWSSVPSQTTANLSNVSAGNYSITVTDINGCNTTATVSLSESPQLTSTVAVTSNYNGQQISCFGLNDGSANVGANGGTGSYSYTWSTTPAQNTPNASGLTAGVYTVIVQDINNCSSTNTVALTEPAAVTATTQVTSNYNGQNISCFGYADGSANVTPNGGTLPYTYVWSSVPTQTAATANNLSAGVYSVVVKDVNNCAVTTTVSLTQPVAVSSSVAVISNYNGQQVSCFGVTDASVTAIAADGTGPYTYTWSTSPVQTGTLAVGIGAGTYSVVITDVNGCNLTRTISVTEPAVLSATTSITSDYNGQNISCYGLTDASANVNVNGGTIPYVYNWTSVPSQTNAALTNVGAGTYSVLVTDINGCNVTRTITINQPTAINAQVLSVSNYNGYNVTCKGSSNGNIDITVNGGTGVYNYTWSNTSTTQDITNLTAGNYSVVVADVNNCTDTVITTLIEPNALVATIDSLTNYNGYNVSCNGLQDGNIYVSVTGGVTNYTYTWSNNTSVEDLSNVGAGNYNLLVTDKNLCTASLDTNLIQPTALSFSATSTSPLCHGLITGSVDASVSGGVMPYTYDWSNATTSEDINSVAAGSYTLTYADANGCNGMAVVSIKEPDTLLINKIVSNIKCYGDSVGSVQLTPTGGTAPYAYAWSNSVSVDNISNVPSGVYTATVTDAHGCVAIDSTDITQPDSLYINLQSPTQANGHNISFYQGNDGSVELTVTGGISPYTYLWSNGNTTEDLYNITAGNYIITVVDDNGCKVNGSIKVTEPLVLEMPEGFSPNNDGFNDLFIVHGIEAYPDNVLTIYNRWGNIVYSKTGYLNEWDGLSNNGEKLPDATYFAILEINKGEIVLKGYVELRR